MLKYLLVLIFLLSILNSKLISSDFYFDAISFKSNNQDTVGKCDIFIVIPYSYLKFENAQNIFYSSYNIVINIYDNDKKLVIEETKKMNVKADDYFQAEGGDGKFSITSHSYLLNPGEYLIEVSIQDNITNSIQKKKRNLNIIGFNQFPFSLSGLMILSTIEEVNGKYKITPYFDDNLASIKDGFFTFFEIYRNNAETQNYKFFYQLVKENSDEIISGNLVPLELKSKEKQFYLYIKPEKYLVGKYMLRVIAVDGEIEDSIPDKKDFLALSQRSVNFTPTLLGNLLENIDESIKRLRYVASSDEINLMQEKESNEEKIKAFMEFWEKLDPSPNTDKNEALIEYFSRIEYANKNFKAYSEGWLTDKGQVYIIYGQPTSINTTNSSYESRVTYEKWLYSNNLEFIFQDKSGLGDFRLVRPFAVTDKYRYK